MNRSNECKSLLGAFTLVGSVVLSPIVCAAPIGGQLTAGVGAISQGGGTTTVNQASQNLSLNWQSFNVGAHESVNFVQPNAAMLSFRFTAADGGCGTGCRYAQKGSG